MLEREGGEELMGKTIKIVQIACASLGGIGRLTRDISDTLNKSNYENYIAYGRGQIIDPKRDFMFGNKIEVMTHVLMTRLTDRTAFYSKSGTSELINFLQETNPDLIHLHNLHGYYLNIQMLFDYLKDTNKPVVWTLHDCWSFTGHCANFDAVQCEQWKTKCTKCVQLRTYPKCYGLGNVGDNFDLKKEIFTNVPSLTLVTPSQWLHNLVKESYLKDYDVKVIRNGIDVGVFSPKLPNNLSKYNLPNKKLVLGVASSWSDRKGLSDFLALSKLLPEDYAIVLVGLDKKQYEKIPSNIIGIMHTENAQELAEIYSKAHIFVNLTYEDNFPTTNLEALACGTSVLTYKTGGSPEAITPEVGYVVNQGDLSGVKCVIQTHEKNERSIINCRNFAKRYDKDICFNEYSLLYQSILQRNGE